MAEAIARLAKAPDEVSRMRSWNVANPPVQDWSQVAAMAVAEYERAVGLVRR
jgi:hypothetical protein